MEYLLVNTKNGAPQPSLVHYIPLVWHAWASTRGEQAVTQIKMFHESKLYFRYVSNVLLIFSKSFESQTLFLDRFDLLR